MKRTIFLIPFLAAAAFALAYGTGETSTSADYDGIREVRVDGSVFEVIVEGTRGRGTSLEVRNESDNYRVLHTTNGSTLDVWVERRSTLFGRPARGQITLQVPGDAVVQVRTSTGSVRISNISGDLINVDTTTGRIELNRVSSAVNIETGTGGVAVRDSSGRFDVTTTTGGIEISDTTADIWSRSSTGGHVYRNHMGDIVARSSTGRIEIDGLQGRLDIETSTGSQDGRDILLTGDSSFESSTGSISMDFIGDVEDLEFDLRSTTGSLQVGRERSQRQLYLGGTGFTITGKSSTGSQEYR